MSAKAKIVLGRVLLLPAAVIFAGAVTGVLYGLSASLATALGVPVPPVMCLMLLVLAMAVTGAWLIDRED